MTDYFALLGEQRRPWLDPDRLKDRFLALSKQTHPDRSGTAAPVSGGGDKFADINAAWNCLRDPRERLRHLLQLELGEKAKEAHSVPSELMNVSLEVGGLCRDVDRFLSERQAQTSALLRVQLFERGEELAEKLLAMQKRVGDGRDELLAEIRRLDGAWTGTAAAPGAGMLRRLQEIESALGFAGRWMSQLQERVVRLAL